MPRRGDRSSYTLLRPDRPILLKGCVAVDRGLINARACEDLICPLFKREIPLRNPWFVRRKISMSFDNIIFDQRVPRPAVHTKVARASGIVCPAVFKCPKQWALLLDMTAAGTIPCIWNLPDITVPSLSTHKSTCTVPICSVRPALAVDTSYVASSFGPILPGVRSVLAAFKVIAGCLFG